jgi:hypothetical protein
VIVIEVEETNEGKKTIDSILSSKRNSYRWYSLFLYHRLEFRIVP